MLFRSYSVVYPKIATYEDPKFVEKLTQMGQSVVDQFAYMDLKYIDIPVIENNLNLVGYFQSEKYFDSAREELLELFEPSSPIRHYAAEKYKEMLSIDNKVSLQVRVGRRQGPDSPELHASANAEFIRKSMAEFDNDCTFVVFADMMEEARKLMPAGKKYIFVENEANYVDMWLMSHFKNYIVSPSTFGWWGAWLSKNENPKVVVMKDWFVKDGAKSYLNDNEIVPSRWKTI